MSAIVEISDRLGTDYYFVSVTTATKSLQLDSPKRYYKIRHQEVSYHQIAGWYSVQQEDIQEIFFA